MIEAVAEEVGQAGFKAVEVPVIGIYFKKFVRDLKEDPWEVARMVARKMPTTVKTCMAGGGFHPFEAPPPIAIMKLFYERLAAVGALDRAQMSGNTFGQMETAFPWLIPLVKELGLEVVIALSYTISPRHTDEYYAKKTRQVLQFKPDVIYLKDQGGLLTPDRVRTLVPVILENAGGVPVELHSHCTTGLADLVYLEALQLGIRTLHTAVPPLANGSSQPSIFSVARNARLMGFKTAIHEERLRPVAERLTAIAKMEKLPIGAPLEYDYAQYIHQVPGGVISNLKHQLAELQLQHRLDEVLEECVQIRKEIGYPIMITPHSQLVVTQAAINVALGERWKIIVDEMILFAMGVFGEDSGYTWMDQNLKDKIFSLHRAKELANRENSLQTPLKKIRESLGGPGVSDEELLLRFIMKGEQEIQTMRAAGPPRQYSNATMPLLMLLKELSKNTRSRYIQIQKGGESLVVRRSS
jgi:oxaloacetate decarboxylase alpha subunit